MPIIVRFIARPGACVDAPPWVLGTLTAARGGWALPVAASEAGGTDTGFAPVPSTMMAAPQRLHVMRTLRPSTLSSGTAYFAGQLPQETCIRF
jgi:hypothetical protein